MTPEATTLGVLRALRSKAALVMLGLSALLRALYTHWAILPYSDGETYDRLAHGLLTTGTYGSPESWAPKAPGYSFFLAGVYGLFGEHHAPLYALQHAIDLGTAVLVLAIALEWGLSRRSALASFAVSLFNPFTVVWASIVLTETLTTFLITLALFVALRLSSGSLWRWASFGVAMSLAALIRPAFAAVAPAVLVPLLILRHMQFTSWLKGSAIAATAFVLVWAPWGVRNAMHYRRIVPYHVGDEQPRAGYNAWCYTWVTQMLDVYGAWWTTPPALPPHAFASNAERAEVETLLARRNPNDKHDPADAPIDARFAELARARRAEAPLRYWLVLPAKRALSLWFTRETTIMAQANVKMSELSGALRTRPLALALKLGLFALMPLLPALMLVGGVLLWRAGKRTVVLPVAGGFMMTLLIEYLMLVKPTYLVVMEPRYVVEFLPAMTPAAVFALSRAFGAVRAARRREAN